MASQRIRTLARVFGGVFLLAVVLLVALHSGPARRLALDRLTKALASQRIEFQAETLRYNLFTLSIDARNLRLRAASSPDLPAFMTIGRVQLNLSLSDLLRRRYVVQSGVAEAVDVQYVVGADGRDNIPRPPAERGVSHQPLDYLITRLSIQKAQVRYENRANLVDFVLPFSSIELAGDAVSRRHRLRLESANGQLRVRKHTETVNRVSGVLDIGRDDARIDQLEVEAAGVQIAADGSLRNFDVPQLGMKLKAVVDAARSTAFLDVGNPITGTAAVEATVSGPLSALAIDGHLSGAKLRFRSLAAAQVDLRAAYDVAGRRADVSFARVEAPWGRISANGTLALDDTRRSQIRAELTRVDAVTIMRDLGLPDLASTRIDGTLDVAWPGLDYTKASGSGTATLTPASAHVTPETIPVGGQLSARIAGGVILAEVQQIAVAGTHLGGRVQIGGRRLDGELRGIAPDVGSTAAVVETLLGRSPGSLLPATVKGTAEFQLQLGGTIAAPAVVLALNAPALTLEAPGRLEISAGVTGTVELTGHRQLDLALAASGVDVRTLHRDAAADLPVTGTLSASGSVRGTLAKPLASLTLKGADLAAFGEQFGTLTADAVFAGDEVTLSRLVIEKPQPDGNGRIIASGVYRVGPQSYTLELYSDNLRLVGLVLPGGPTVRSPVLISGKVAGNLSSPTGTVNAVLSALEIDGDRPVQLGRVVIAATAEKPRATITASAERFSAGAEAVVTLARPWPFDATVRVSSLDLEKLPFGLRGVATLDGSLRGTRDSIAPDLVLTIENGGLSSPQFPPDASNIELRARVADGAATIERLTGTWGRATIDASGTIPLEVVPLLPVEISRQGGPATISALVRGLDPATIPGMPSGLSGHIDLDLEASAARADLTALEGHISFPRLEILSNRLTLTQQEPSRIGISAGRATVEKLALSGSAGSVVASGSIGLAGDHGVDVTVDGALNLAALSVFGTAVRTDGTAKLKVAARGTMAAPDLKGTVDLSDATVASNDLDIAVTNVAAQVALGGRRIELTKLAGDVNGGTLEGSGHVTLAGGRIDDIDLKVSAKDVAYDAPLNMRSLSDATIRLTRRGEEFLVAGQMTIKEAGLTSDINFDDKLFAAARAPRTLDLTKKRDPLLDRVRFDIDVDTAAPVMIDNNLARAEIDADLRIVGNPYEPGLTGRLTLAEGGQLTLNARRYEVERGVITFVDERRIAPSIDLVLNTKASNYDVRIAVTGTPGKTETSWTSEPPLSEPDIMALVMTGRTVDEMRGEESEVARVQALSYLTGRVGSKFGRGLERATGISEVRIEPVLIANETDPTARLTVGQNVTNQVKLIYSTNLTDSNDQIWVAEYDVTRRFQLRGVREREDDSYRADFRHDVRFGGEPAPRRQQARRPTIARLTVAASDGEEPAPLRKLFTLEEGDAYDFFAARSGIERIERRYLESGYLQSRVRLEREIAGDKANLTVRVNRGPLIVMRFEGVTPPSKVREKVRAAWHSGVFDKQRTTDSIRELREWLMLDNHLQPRIDARVEDRTGQREIVYAIQPGPRYDKVVLAFEGAARIAPKRLDAVVEQQRLERQLFTDPAVVTNLLQRYYYEQGYLSAEVDAPRYEFQEHLARVVVAVREGPQFQIRRITITGNTVYPSTDILAKLPLAPATPFVSAAAERSLDRIRELYWPKGYNDVRSEYALILDRNAAAVDIDVAIVEGQRSMVAEIAVDGNRKTSERLVRGQVELSPSQPLDLAVLARSRRNLYGTGAFSIVDITREEIEASAKDQDEKPIRVKVSVREVQPIQLRYGLSYDTEGGLGGILDFSIHNSLGKARVFGMQGRYDSEIHEGRVYVSQPSLRTWPRKTTASVYFREDLNPPTEQTDPFDISRHGASIQQEMHFRKVYVWSYGYRYELATTLEPSLGEGVTETVRVTPLSGTITRETRDEVLDASKGTFLSQAFGYSPAWLGSDRPYV
ncbi:MAG: translocation/assembly module TamB domain-containing protein, partial [Acidobacteriota bacterium]